WYPIAGVAVLVGALAVLAPKQDVAFLLERVTAVDAPYGYAFALGLLQAAWTFTGYDASAHVTEETVDPSRVAPWGIVLSVAVSGVVGWIMLLTVTAAIVDLPATLAAENPFLYVLTTGLGPALGNALLWSVLRADGVF